MKRMVICALAMFFLTLGSLQAQEPIQGPQNVYGFKTKTLEGKPIRLSHYRGKVLLIVNVADKCGFTPEYKGLEALYRKFKDRGFVVLGFPCNQFAHQEPGDAKQIETFCKVQYGVTFPQFQKIDVNGPHRDPLYRYLETVLPGGNIGWNFTKFLINRQGVPIERYASPVKPESLEKDIEQALSEKS